MTTQMAVLLAVKALVAATLPAADVRGFDGDGSFPETIGAGGTVLGFPGNPGEPQIDLSPPCYNYEHEIPIEVAAAAGAGGLTLDEMLEAIGNAVEADPYLGDLCHYLEATAPVREDRTLQDVTINWAEFSLVAQYSTAQPLG